MVADRIVPTAGLTFHQGLQRSLRRIANHLIASASHASSPALSPALQSDVIHTLMKRAYALGDHFTYLQLIKQFAPRLERQIPPAQLDELLDTAFRHRMLLAPRDFVGLGTIRARVLCELHESDRAAEILNECWVVAADDPVLISELCIREGLLSVFTGNYDAAREYYERGLVLARETNDVERTSTLHNNLGNMLYHLDRYEEAVVHYEQALVAAHLSADPVYRARAEGGMAVALDELARFSEAEAHYHIAIEAASEAEDQLLLVINRVNLIYHALLQEKYSEAVARAADALAMARAFGLRRQEAFILHNLGQAYLGLNAWEDALDFFNQALEQRILLGQALYIATTRDFIERLVGEIQQALDLDSVTRDRILAGCQNALAAARNALPPA